MLTFITILAAYLIGSIPSGLIIGKTFYKIDIREHGSKNLGGTNTFRTLGVKAGLTVTIMDILKGTLATCLPYMLGVDMHLLLAGVIAVIGHMFPILQTFGAEKRWQLQLVSFLLMNHGFLSLPSSFSLYPYTYPNMSRFHP